jgi:RecB family exonuclease
MRYEHVFLLGAAEGQFPQRFSESSLLTERQRADWAPHGVALDLRRDLTCREMLLFYMAASRAGRTLTVTFAESDSAGRPGAPSAMLLSLLEPLGGLEALDARGALHRAPRGRFLVPVEELGAPADAVTAAAAGLFSPRAGGAPGALRWAVQHRPEVLRRVAWGLHARDRRWKSGPCDAFDGRLSDAAILKAIAERFGPQAVFSASQLNSFGQCPWQFFASYVLKLAPLEEPQRRLEPLARGTLIHDVLQGVFTRLGAEFGLPVRLPGIDAEKVERALQDAMAEQGRRIDLRRPPYPVLWEVLQRQAMRQLREYLRAQRDERQALQPEALCFELGFGLTGSPGGRGQDPRSRAEPVPVRTPRGLFVVDYKTGLLPSFNDILAGRSLQIPLYAAAAEAILGEPCVGGAYHRVAKECRERWFAAVKPARNGRFQANEEYAAQQAQALETAGRFVEEIRAGRFDLLPSAKCPGWCPFARICQFSPARAEVKAPPPREEAQP